MNVRLSRDAVAAADDLDSHERDIDVDGRKKLFALIGEVINERYLPLMPGEHATWVVRASPPGPAVAVVAQHWGRWQPADLLVETDVEMATIGDAIHFEYRADGDPAATLAELRST